MDGEGLVGRARKRLIANPTISKEKKKSELLIGAAPSCLLTNLSNLFEWLEKINGRLFFQIVPDLLELSSKVFIRLMFERRHSFRYTVFSNCNRFVDDVVLWFRLGIEQSRSYAHTLWFNSNFHRASLFHMGVPPLGTSTFVSTGHYACDVFRLQRFPLSSVKLHT